MSLCKAVEALIKSKPSEGKTLSLTLKDGCVTTQKLANEAVSTGKLEEGAVTQGKIAEGAVGEHELEDGGVTKDKIASSAVTAEKISQNAVTAEKIAEGAVTGGKLSDNSVGNSNVEDNAITASKIHDGSITRAKMAPGSIATEHIVDGSVTREKMAVDSVSTDSLCDGSVAEEKIINGAITPDKLADNCVSVDKLSVEVQDTLKLYDLIARNGYKYMGMASPETKPETDKGNVFYIAATEGSYDKFATSGGILDPSGEVTDAIHLDYGEVALLLYNGYEELQAKTLDTKKSEPILKAGWNKVTLPLTSREAIEKALKEESDARQEADTEIRNRKLTADDIPDSVISTSKISDEAVTTDKIAKDTVKEEQLSKDLQKLISEFVVMAEQCYTFVDKAIPSDTPISIAGNYFYLATKAGEYTHFHTEDIKDGKEVPITLEEGESALLVGNYYPLERETGWHKLDLPFVMKDVYEAKVKELESKASTGSVVEGYYDSNKNIFRSVPQYDSSGADVWIDEVEIGPGNPSTVIGTKYANKMDDAHNRIYIDLSTNKAYRYNDNGYTQLVF